MYCVQCWSWSLCHPFFFVSVLPKRGSSAWDSRQYSTTELLAACLFVGYVMMGWLQLMSLLSAVSDIVAAAVLVAGLLSLVGCV